MSKFYSFVYSFVKISKLSWGLALLLSWVGVASQNLDGKKFFGLNIMDLNEQYLQEKKVIIAESLYDVNYGLSIIASKVSQIISVMKT